jgi:putative transposon-encoded protein
MIPGSRAQVLLEHKIDPRFQKNLTNLGRSARVEVSI